MPKITAEEIMARATSKATPREQEPPSLPRPPPQREERASSSSTGQVAQVDVQDPDEIYDAFASYLRGYYDNMRNTGHLINERDSLEAINQNTGERTVRHMGYMFDVLFSPTVIRRRIPVAVYSEVKRLVMTEGQEFALNYVNDKIRQSTTGRRSSSRSSSSGAKKAVA